MRDRECEGEGLKHPNQEANNSSLHQQYVGEPIDMMETYSFSYSSSANRGVCFEWLTEPSLQDVFIVT